MFTGLIQNVCFVNGLLRAGSDATLTVDLGSLAKQTKISDSVAVNGVCLTVSKLSGTLATFDLSGETLTKTNLGKLTDGSKVNIELALKADDRFGGHFVLGHVDGAAIIRNIKREGDFANITFSTSKEMLDLMIPKGSVAVDGISLTIADLNAEGFTVAVIPQTLRQTTLGEAKINQKVNVESDIITKTVKRHLENLLPQKIGLTTEKLRELGF